MFKPAFQQASSCSSEGSTIFKLGEFMTLPFRHRMAVRRRGLPVGDCATVLVQDSGKPRLTLPVGYSGVSWFAFLRVRARSNARAKGRFVSFDKGFELT